MSSLFAELKKQTNGKTKRWGKERRETDRETDS